MNNFNFLKKNNKVFVFLPDKILLFILVILNLSLNAQDLSLKISENQFLIKKKSYNGYSTKLYVTYSKVKKEWWRYIKKIALLKNHKTHYIFTFPANKHKSNSNISFISTIEDNENFVTLKTALVNQEMNNQFKLSARNILFNFKIKFYISEIQKQLVKSEKEVFKISKMIDGYKKKTITAKHKMDKKKGDKMELSEKILIYQSKENNLSIKLDSIQNNITKNKIQLTKIR